MLTQSYTWAQFGVTIGNFPSIEYPTDSLVAYYPFDGNANDESGNGYDLTVDGATLTTGKDGDANSAYLFVNTDDVLKRTDSDVRIASSITVSYWVNLSTTPSQLERHFRLRKNAEYGVIYFNSEWNIQALDELNNRKFYGYSTIPLNEWHFIVVEIDVDTVRYYLDDSNVSINTIVDDDAVDYTADLVDVYLGNSQLFVNSIKGSLDQFRIYNRILTDDEKTALYNEQ